MLRKALTVAVMTIAGFMLSTSASAQVYVGGSVGEAKWNIDCTGLTSCKTNDTAYKVFGGYNFTPEWAVETSYFDLGEPKLSAGSISGSLKGTGFDVSAVYKAHLSEQWTVFAKLGVAAVKGEISGSIGALGSSTSTNSTQPVVGFGVIYNINPNFGIRADVDTRKVDISSSTGVSTSGNVTNASIGLQVTF